MATKKAATKKKTTATTKKAAAPKTTTKVKTVSAKKATKLPVGIVYEKNPDDHTVSGKYTFFYVLFACTTLLFAAVATWLFVFSSELLAKYESIKACARNHTTCEIRYFDDEEVAE